MKKYLKFFWDILNKPLNFKKSSWISSISLGINFYIIMIAISVYFMAPFIAKDTEQFRYLLVVVAGLSNLVALIDISGYSSKNTKVTIPKLVNRVLFVQCFLLAIIIGIDIAILFKLISITLLIFFPLTIAIILLIVVMFYRKPVGNTSNIEHLAVFLALILVGVLFSWTIIMFFPNGPEHFVERALSLFKLSDKSIVFIQYRFELYLHLLIIPLTYLIGDFINGKICKQKEIEESIPLDSGLLLTGSACAWMGWYTFGLDNPNSYLFEAGSCAAIMIFANYMYLIMKNNKAKLLLEESSALES